MTLSPYLPHLGKIEMYYSGERDNAVNVLWFVNEEIDGTGSDVLSTAAETLADSWATNLVAHMNEGITFTDCVVTDWSSDTGLSGAYESNTGGGVALALVPAQCCMLVNWTIASRYRGGRPRNYLPGSGTAHMATNQTWDSTVITAMNTGIAQFLTDVAALTIGASTSRLVCYHRPTDIVAASQEVIIGGSLNPEMATIKRRVRRYGRGE